MTAGITTTAPPLPPTTSPAASAGQTPRAFLAGFVQSLLMPLLGLAALLAGWSLTAVTGWPAATAAVAGWSVGAAAWLRHRGWPAVMAHLVAWAAPTALVAPLWGPGWLSPAGLVVWGPVSALLAIALAAVYDPRLIATPGSRPDRTPPARTVCRGQRFDSAATAASLTVDSGPETAHRPSRRSS